MTGLAVIGLGLALAAAGGALLRYLIGVRFNAGFPYGTLAVNLIASFVLGLLVSADGPLPIVLGVGGLGALSTWSTAANEAATMAREDEVGLAIGYLMLSTTTATFAAWLGLRVGPVFF